MNKINIFVKSILIPVLVGTLVGLVTSGSIDYNSLQQPSFAPPGFIFSIVVMMIIFEKPSIIDINR